MPFDLTQFNQNGLVYGGARPSKFDINVTIPTGINADTNFERKLHFTCKAASIPQFQVGVVQVPYFGRKIKHFGDRTWSNWSITVMMDEDYVTRRGFESWSNYMNTLESNVYNDANDSGSNFKTNWEIIHYSKNNSFIGDYTLVGGWPITLGPVQLDWDGTDRINEFQVEVAFDWLTPGTNFISGQSPYSGEETPSGSSPTVVATPGTAV